MRILNIRWRFGEDNLSSTFRVHCSSYPVISYTTSIQNDDPGYSTLPFKNARSIETDSVIACSRVYFDIEIADRKEGKVIFELVSTYALTFPPLHSFTAPSFCFNFTNSL